MISIGRELIMKKLCVLLSLLLVTGCQTASSAATAETETVFGKHELVQLVKSVIDEDACISEFITENSIAGYRFILVLGTPKLELVKNPDEVVWNEELCSGAQLDSSKGIVTSTTIYTGEDIYSKMPVFGSKEDVYTVLKNYEMSPIFEYYVNARHELRMGVSVSSTAAEKIASRISNILIEDSGLSAAKDNANRYMINENTSILIEKDGETVSFVVEASYGI